jgi:hypothetical protein
MCPDLVLQAQTARNATWVPVFEVSDPDATTLTVTGLVPFMLYKLRIISNNVVGASSPSEPTKEFQTIQAPPAHPPYNVTVRAMSATELRVRWIVSTFGCLSLHLERQICPSAELICLDVVGSEYIAVGIQIRIHILVVLLLCIGFCT